MLKVIKKTIDNWKNLPNTKKTKVNAKTTQKHIHTMIKSNLLTIKEQKKKLAKNPEATLRNVDKREVKQLIKNHYFKEPHRN